MSKEVIHESSATKRMGPPEERNLDEEEKVYDIAHDVIEKEGCEEENFSKDKAGTENLKDYSQLLSDTVGDTEIDTLADSVQQISLADDVLCQLKTLQCPFTWNLEEMLIHRSPNDVILRVEEKEEEIVGEDGQFLLLRQLGLQFVLCYEHYSKGDIAAARERQYAAEKLIEGSEACPFCDGLKHLSRSCLAFIYHLSGIISECRAIIKTIVAFEKLDNVNRACIIGMRAIVLMEYGYEGTKQAVSYVEEALELDPSSAEWHFLLGKSLRRIRRINFYNAIPDKRELKALEKAVEMSTCSGYCTFLAQTYRETAFRVYSLNKHNLSPLKATLDAMNKKSAEYYRKSLQLAPESSHINNRCALGFLKLPPPFRDVKLAKACIDKTLELAPTNAMAHHVAGKYYEQVGDIDAAKRSYNAAGQFGAFGAYMDFLRLQFKTDKKYNPLPLLEKMLNTFLEEPYQVGIISQIGAYYYLMKNDLKTAVAYWLRIIENYATDRLKTYKPICIFIKKPVDLLQVAIDEARVALSDKNIAAEEATLYKRLISKYEGTELLYSLPKAHRQEMLEESEEILREEAHRFSNRRGRERGGKRGRGTYQEKRGGRGRVTGEVATRGRGYHHSGDRRDSSHKRGGRGRGTGEGATRGRGYHYSGDRRDSSHDSGISSSRHNIKEKPWYKKPRSRDSSCDSSSSQKETSKMWRNRRAPEEVCDGTNYEEFRKNQRDWKNSRKFGEGSNRDSSCDSMGNRGSVPKRGGGNGYFQKDTRHGSRMYDYSRDSQKYPKEENTKEHFNETSLKPDWRECGTVKEHTYERESGPDRTKSRNKGDWRQGNRYNQEEFERFNYSNSRQGGQHRYRKSSYGRDRDSSADSNKSDGLSKQYNWKHSHQNFQRSEHDTGSYSRHFKDGDAEKHKKLNTNVQHETQNTMKGAKAEKSSWSKRGCGVPIKETRTEDYKDKSVQNESNHGNVETQQKLNSRREMAFRITIQKGDENKGKESK